MTNKLKQPIRKVITLAPKLMFATIMVSCMYIGMFSHMKASASRNKR